MYYYSNLQGVGFSLNPFKLVGKIAKGAVSLIRGQSVQAGPVTVAPTAAYVPEPPPERQLVAGVPNTALLIGGALAATALIVAMGRRRRNPRRRRR